MPQMPIPQKVKYHFFFFFFFKEPFILRRLEKGTKPILTPHDGRLHFGLSGIRTYDHPLSNDCAMVADIIEQVSVRETGVVWTSKHGF